MMTREKSLFRFSQEWRDSLRFIDYSYSEFIDFLLNSNEKFYFSEKVDGELNTLIYEKEKDPYFITKSGVIRNRNYPVLIEYKLILDRIKNINDIVIAGELKAVQDTNKFYPFNQSQSIIQTGDVNKVHHFPFDIFRLNGKQIRSDFPTLDKFFHNKKYINIPRWIYGNVDDFRRLWNTIVTLEHGEGIVAFSPSVPTTMYRIKHILTADVAVIGAGNKFEKNWAKGKIGYLKLALLDENNNFLLTSKLGTGFNDKIRIELFDYIIKNSIEEVDGEFTIPPKIIVEVKYRRHRFSKVPLLHFSKNKYIKIGDDDGVMMDQPSFVRFRNDKRLLYKDLSIKQFPL